MSLNRYKFFSEFSIYSDEFDMLQATRYVHFVNENFYHLEFEQCENISILQNAKTSSKRQLAYRQFLKSVLQYAKTNSNEVHYENR